MRDTVAARLPPSSHYHTVGWYIYRLIIGLVCVTIMRQVVVWQALADGARRYQVCGHGLRHSAAPRSTRIVRATFQDFILNLHKIIGPFALYD